jgi:hypothetical protein
VKTCRVTCEVRVDGEIVEEKTWPKVDIMRTSATRGWATRQLNDWHRGRPGKVITVQWDCFHGAPSYTHFSGRMSAVNGHVHRWGIFE